jgi:ferrous iron transport protein B
MDWIEWSFGQFSELVKSALPEGVFSDLVSDGILAGLGGVLVFLPQIALLFCFISILEESGYMARVSFLTDRIMQKFGMNGKSIVPIVGGFACAVPSIMATRTITNFRERLLTIFIIPLMSCSARLPVYTLLISLAVPDQLVWGFIDLRGLALLGMYFLGFIMGLLVAFILKVFIKEKDGSFFLLEMPLYRIPSWKNVRMTVWEKSYSFVGSAGKVIMTVSIILWFLSNYGPGRSIQETEKAVRSSYTKSDIESVVASAKLEASYAGRLGKWIEPAIKPLGYDWKIGISLITSFAAREVFVGTMATIYKIGSIDGAEFHLSKAMSMEKDPITHKQRYGLGTVFSLMLFYAFALQCISTIAITYKETKSLFWTILQVVAFTGLAYISAYLAFQWFS